MYTQHFLNTEERRGIAWTGIPQRGPLAFSWTQAGSVGFDLWVHFIFISRWYWGRLLLDRLHEDRGRSMVALVLKFMLTPGVWSFPQPCYLTFLLVSHDCTQGQSLQWNSWRWPVLRMLLPGLRDQWCDWHTWFLGKLERGQSCRAALWPLELLSGWVTNGLLSALTLDSVIIIMTQAIKDICPSSVSSYGHFILRPCILAKCLCRRAVLEAAVHRFYLLPDSFCGNWPEAEWEPS